MRNDTEILNAKIPSDIFTENINTLKDEYRAYCFKWHPDLNSNSEKSHNIIAKVNALYVEGIRMLETNTWEVKGQLLIKSKLGKTYTIKLKNSHEFELGKIYISNSLLIYEISEKYKNLYNNYIKRVETLSYPNEVMRSAIEIYLPKSKILDTFQGSNNNFFILIQKSHDTILLKDILDYYNGKVPHEHVTWILSSLYNIACYLDYSKLSHNGISLDTYLISPQYHSGLLLGGWWYTVSLGEKMLQVSEKTFNIMPPKVKNTKLGSIETDLESIRLIGRELLGDKSGTNLKVNNLAPEPMIDWLRGVSGNKARIEYENWQKVIHESYKERKFIIMPVEPEELYQKVSKI